MKQDNQISKKGFLLYFDQISVFEALPGNQCKELILAIFNFPNNQEPKLSPLVNIAFLSIRNTLLRDTEKWKNTKIERQKAGSLGGKARVVNLKQNQANQANATFVKQNQANQAVSVSDSVSVNNNKEIIPSYEKQKKAFEWAETISNSHKTK